MFRLLNKIKSYLNIKRAFKGSFVLKNGTYCLKGNSFFLFENKNAKSKVLIKVKTKDKFNSVIQGGIFKITPYKTLFMDEKTVFTFINNKNSYHI